MVTSYCTSENIWDYLNDFTKVRDQYLGQGNGSLALDITDGQNIISGSFVLKTSSTSGGYLTAGTVTSSYYTVDLDDGRIALTTAGAAALSGSHIYANYNSALMPDSSIQELIEIGKRDVDRDTGRNWDLQTSTEYISPSFHKQMVFWTDKFPIVSVSSLLFNQAKVDSPESYLTASEGIGNDYLLNDKDKKLGRFRVIDNFPSVGMDRIKIIYSHGYTDATRPLEAKKLNVLYVMRSLLTNPGFSDNIIRGKDTYVPLSTEVIDAQIEMLVSKLKKYDARVITQQFV